MQVSTAEFKKGLRIVFDGNPYTIVDFQHVKPGKGGAFVRTKLKHMKLGKVIDNTFRSGEKVELVDFEEKHMQFLYKDDRYNFMDTETYEQVSLSADEVGEAREYLRENTEVDVLYIAGSPTAVELWAVASHSKDQLSVAEAALATRQRLDRSHSAFVGGESTEKQNALRRLPR